VATGSVIAREVDQECCAQQTGVHGIGMVEVLLQSLFGSTPEPKIARPQEHGVTFHTHMAACIRVHSWAAYRPGTQFGQGGLGLLA
jgi:hypothetical protein